MRLASFHTDAGPAAAVQIGDDLIPASALDAPSATVRGLLAVLDADGLHDLGRRAEDASERISLTDATLGPPVTDPQKIICLGLNYRDHAEETGQDIPTAPMWFAKFANSLLGSGQDIVLPAAHAEYVDYEAELALVIGRTARNVRAEDALEHIAGAMPFNDVSARDLQLQTPCGQVARRSTPSLRAAPHSSRSTRSMTWARWDCEPRSMASYCKRGQPPI